MRAHGDPLAGSTEKGAAKTFVEEAALSEAGECVIFPFFRNKEGYGRLNLDSGRYVGAHFYACEIRNGSRPSSEHEARHSCGNGHEGCVNGSHLSWGTRKENVADAIKHGTAMFWGVPVSSYGAFRSSIGGRVDTADVKEWLAANDNVPTEQRRVA
jgi:hypothetical protein